MRLCLERTLAVGVGGFFGAVARYWLSGLVQRVAGSDLPWGTFVVNVAGSFLLGLILTLSLERIPLGLAPRLLLAVGFCGGFTTMSTFGYETLMLLRDGSVGAAVANVAATVIVCVAGVWCGGILARFLCSAMKAPTEGKLLRIFVGEGGRHGGRPLYEALVRKAHELGLAGATVWRGIEGYGAGSRIHTARILRLSEDLPILIEIVDSEEKIRQALPHLDAVMEEAGSGGLITLEKAEILKYAPGRGRG